MRLIMTQDLRQDKEHEPTHHLLCAAAGWVCASATGST
jgi:hypothetical protein